MAFKATTLLVFGCLIAGAWGQGLSLEELISNVFTPKPDTGGETSTAATFKPTPPTQQPDLNPSRGGEAGGGGYKSCGLDKECVPRHLCVDGGIVTTGENFIDIRIDDSVCTYNELCCDLPNKVSETI